MDFKATSKYIRISPRKARLVADAVRPLSVEDAMTHLKFMNKKAAPLLRKTMHSAISNADMVASVDQKQLVIKRIEVDEGPTFKRWRPASRGMAHGYGKYTSHITVILATKEGTKIGEKKQVKVTVRKAGESAKEAKKAVAEINTVDQNTKEKGKSKQSQMTKASVGQRTTNK